MRHSRRRRAGGGRGLVLLALAVAAAGLWGFERQILPLMTTMAQYECRRLCTEAINQAVVDAMGSQPQPEQALYRIGSSPEGTITSIVADAARLNQLEAQLTDLIEARLQTLQSSRLTIPMGTVLGWQLVSGRGPLLPLRIRQQSYVDSEIYSRLREGGINQTELLVFIRFRVRMSAILSGFITGVDVEEEICVAQVLVVGEVPRFYVQ